MQLSDANVANTCSMCCNKLKVLKYKLNLQVFICLSVKQLPTETVDYVFTSLESILVKPRKKT
jgi:hypothetical protein